DLAEPGAEGSADTRQHPQLHARAVRGGMLRGYLLGAVRDADILDDEQAPDYREDLRLQRAGHGHVLGLERRPHRRPSRVPEEGLIAFLTYHDGTLRDGAERRSDPTMLEGYACPRCQHIDGRPALPFTRASLRHIAVQAVVRQGRPPVAPFP